MAVVRTGVVGAGHLGYHHARNYAALEGAQLVGVVEPDEERGAKAARDLAAPWYKDLEPLIAAGVDAVSVVTPTTHHCAVATRLFEAGIDVLVEKPISATIDEAESMVAKAAEKGRILQVGHIERFNGAVIALFDSGITPKFIECHRLSPFPNRGDDVSVVLDLMIHDLDIIRAFDTSEVVFVDAMGVAVFSKSEDIANVRIRFASGCVANLTCSRVSMERMRKIRIFSNDAYVSTDYSEQAVLVYRKKPGPLEPGMTPMDLITIESMDVHKEEPLKLELASFIECVRTRKRPLVAGEDGLAALRLADHVIRSIQEHA